MSRPPLMGYNHNVRYKDRVYHVQTEDSGAANPRIFTHLFFRGAIVASSCTKYDELAIQPDHIPEVKRLMREQHKAMMKTLRRGEQDQKIVAVLGTLYPDDRDQGRWGGDESTRRIRCYRHQLKHADRVYTIQTNYLATIVTDVFFETILIASVRQDCSQRYQPGSSDVKKLAQVQHKSMMLKLRDSQFDDKIRCLLGSLTPREERQGSSSRKSVKVPIERYAHQVSRQGTACDVTTLLFGPESPHVLTQIRQGQTMIDRFVLTAADLENCSTPGDLRVIAQEQHKFVLRQLLRGDLDYKLLPPIASRAG